MKIRLLHKTLYIRKRKGGKDFYMFENSYYIVLQQTLKLLVYKVSQFTRKQVEG